jgi:transposase
LRKSFDTLAGVVRESLRLDPLSGHLFVFTNSRKNRIKILCMRAVNPMVPTPV